MTTDRALLDLSVSDARMAAASLCWSGLGAAACAHYNAGAKLILRPLLEPSCYDDLLSPLQHSLSELKNNRNCTVYNIHCMGMGGIRGQ